MEILASELRERLSYPRLLHSKETRVKAKRKTLVEGEDIEAIQQSDKKSKFYIRRNNNKVSSIETEHTIIAHLLPWSDLQKCM